ncbi:unnamed protein product, partial [Mesorhabditis spiculigera]
MFFLSWCGVHFTYFSSGLLKRRLLDIEQHYFYRFIEIYGYVMYPTLGITFSCLIWVPYFAGTLKSYEGVELCLHEPDYCGRDPMIIAKDAAQLNFMFRIAFWVASVGMALYLTIVVTAIAELCSKDLKLSPGAYERQKYFTKIFLLQNVCAVGCVTVPGVCLFLGLMGIDNPFVLTIGQITFLLVEGHSLCNALVFIFATKAYRDRLWRWATFGRELNGVKIHLVSLPNAASISEVNFINMKTTAHFASLP